jgi:high-affinity Fe2+/Pb2+ permease
MSTILYLKVFSGLPGITYLENTLKIPFKHILLGLGILIVAVYLVFKVSNDQRLIATSILLTMLIFGLVVSAVRVHRIQPDIATAVSQNKTVIETKYAYDGGSSWFPLSWLAGVVLGIILVAFTRGLGWQNSLYISILAFGAGFILAIGLTYMYWEYKYNRTIEVYRYERVK